MNYIQNVLFSDTNTV